MIKEDSSLNFELHETPFSLNLKWKKSFAQYWNKAGQSAHQNHIPQHVTDTVHQPHHPHVGQPVIHPEKATQNQADVFNDQQVPQHQLHHPHYVTDPGHQSDQPDTYGDLAPGQVHDHHKQQAVNLVKKVKILEQTCNEEQKEKEHLQQEYLSIDKSYKKLVGENRELQVKHEQVCADMKTLKSEKDQFARELNTASVALTTTKKILNENQKEFDRRVSQFEKELLKLSEFKEEKESEDRRRKRAEKKARQKKRKMILPQMKKIRKILMILRIPWTRSKMKNPLVNQNLKLQLMMKSQMMKHNQRKLKLSSNSLTLARAEAILIKTNLRILKLLHLNLNPKTM